MAIHHSALRQLTKKLIMLSDRWLQVKKPHAKPVLYAQKGLLGETDPSKISIFKGEPDRCSEGIVGGSPKLLQT